MPAPEVFSAARASADAIVVGQREFAFDLETTRVPSGLVEFAVENRGTEHHEFVVVPFRNGRYSLPAAEHEALEPGDRGGLRAWLDPGQYRLVCLLVTLTPEGPLSHLELGMSADFEVAP